MNSTNVFLGFLAIIYVFIIIITMIKSKRFFTTLFLTILQGICAIFAVNFIGQYIAIHIPINQYTLGVSSFGGISGVILMLLCDTFLIWKIT